MSGYVIHSVVKVRRDRQMAQEAGGEISGDSAPELRSKRWLGSRRREREGVLAVERAA